MPSSPPQAIEASPSNRVLERMLERLLATLVNGPGLNCRPHRSRQRVDLTAFSKLHDLSPSDLLRKLLGEDARAKCVAKTRPPKDEEDEQPWRDQETLLSKLRGIAEDARTYEQDTGAHVLQIGFPLLSIPETASSRQILAPVAFIPISLVITRGITRAIDIRSTGDGIDRVVPNTALLAWVERQTGQKPAELYNDQEGEDPWREIRELAEFIASATGAQIEPPIAPESELRPAPRTDEAADHATILPCAVIGLFPQANEALLRDTQALLAGETLHGPITQFVSLAAIAVEEGGSRIEEGEKAAAPSSMPLPASSPTPTLISEADPFQSRAVRLSRQSPALVIHGPPGTGKSQTITNIIGDHLARGQRVLVVSDKRTALDVVANRLRHLGLTEFFGVVHDPQRDRRELYKSLRQQLENLPQAQTDARAQRDLEAADESLKKAREEIAGYFAALHKSDDRGRRFADLVAQWFSLADDGAPLDPATIKPLTMELLDTHERAVESLLMRAASVNYADNPWCQAAGIDLATFMDSVMSELRAAMAQCLTDAESTDATIHPAIPAFADDLPLEAQAAARLRWAQRLGDLLLATDPAILAHWALRTLEEAQTTKTALDAAAPQLALLRSGPLDPELLEQCRRRSTNPSHLPSTDEAADQGRALRDYAQAYRDASTRIATVHAAAPNVSLELIARWLGQGPAACERARKRLISMGSLIKPLAAAELDRQLALQFERQPISSEQVIAWLPILHEYVHAARKWYAFLTPGHKKPAQPIAAYFGLPLNAETGGRMRDFVTALRHRLDLKADLESGIITTTLAPLPSDDELLDHYRDNLSVVKAICDPTLAAQPGQDVPTSIAHTLMTKEAAAATIVLRAWNMDLTPQTADRLATFLSRLGARLRLAALTPSPLYSGERAGVRGSSPADETTPEYQATSADDAKLEHAIVHHTDAVTFIVDFAADPNVASLHPLTLAALSNPVKGLSLVEGLRKSDRRAKAITKLLQSITSAGLFAEPWTNDLDHSLRAGNGAASLVRSLSEKLPGLESVLRVNDSVDQLPAVVQAITPELLKRSANAPTAMAALRKAVIAGEIRRRLDADPTLRRCDARTLKEALDHFRELQDKRQDLARKAIRHRWITVQKQKLLAGEGARLGHAGAELRRRLTLRGERATRLRQVIQLGRQIPGGDPFFDLCPVWMASPETVAQIFPREPIFDVVIFDEASQCRLEEALPVLTRAHRVVVAGDPQQLPPTRFFESGVEDSEEEAIETEQELFEAQQSQIEDLLGAALSLAIGECSLDVHYRSRHGELIRFSNEHFYASRLQAIPGRPSDVPVAPPVKLHRVDGIYEKRRNLREAEEVCRLVRELLEQENPPSIGIACFNLPQRDLIVEKLDEMAEEDSAFSKKLDAARKREGAGSFEGLFVKNLENVQGDERDHLIISTTYGPDAKGKFRRQFGPVGQAGGGRRLNVLITRARNAVHVVTSVPRDAYASLPPIPTGQTAGGAYLLLAYLRYAEHLTDEQPPLERPPGRLNIWPTRHPAALVESIANHMSKEGIAGEVYWGNEGFCVDLVRHDNGDATGLLCDAPRFPAADAVEWDAFRTTMLESQGWTLHRLWSPHFFRDPIM